jgi:DNA-binding MarR family transcriptional regulator
MTKDVDQLVDLLFEAKDVWRSLFHEQQSVIPTDILLSVVHRYVKKTPLSMKQLVAELPHSEAGIKQHLRKLEGRELITRQSVEHDGRVIQLIPSQPAVEAVTQMGVDMKNIFARPPQGHSD